jgi:hypothetical protein
MTAPKSRGRRETWRLANAGPSPIKSHQVAIGGVEKIDSRFQRALDKRPALFFAEAPRVVASIAAAIAHAAETNARDIKAGAAELGVFHAGDFTPALLLGGERSAARRYGRNGCNRWSDYCRREAIARGTEGSNPPPSSGQSVSHGKQRAAVENPGFSRGCAGDGRWRGRPETGIGRRLGNNRR